MATSGRAARDPEPSSAYLAMCALLLETKGCAAVGRVIVMSSDSVEAWDAQEWVVIELQVRPWRPFHPHP